MGAITAAVVLVALLVIWAYLKFLPEHDNMDAVHGYNKMTLVFIAFIWFLWFVKMHFFLANLDRLEYQTLICVGGGAAGAIVLLLVFFLLRNFWIFKSANNRPGWFS